MGCRGWGPHDYRSLDKEPWSCAMYSFCPGKLRYYRAKKNQTILTRLNELIKQTMSTSNEQKHQPQICNEQSEVNPGISILPTPRTRFVTI